MNATYSYIYRGLCALQLYYSLAEEREKFSPAYYKIFILKDIDILDMEFELTYQYLLLILEQIARLIGCKIIHISIKNNNKNLLIGKFLNYLKQNNLLAIDVPPLKLIWMRHAEVFLPPEIDHFPEDNMINISDVGIKKAKEIKLALRATTPIEYPIFVSNLKRAQQTVNNIHYNSLHFKMVKCDFLAECFPNYFIGKNLVELYDKHGKYFWNKFVDDPDTFLQIDNYKLYQHARTVQSQIKNIMHLNIPYNTRFIISHGLLHNLFLIKCLNGDYSKINYICNLKNLHTTIFNYDVSNKIFSVSEVNYFANEYIL